MTDDDFEVFGLAIHLAASKRRTYQEHAVRYFKQLTEFFQDNGLLTHQLLSPSELPDREFRIMRSDLTDNGYELVKNGLDKWTRKVQGGQPIEDVSILVRELERIRSREC